MRPAALLALVLPACTTLSLHKIELATAPPSNVAVYLTVDKGSEPVTGLGPERFHLWEDGRKISAGRQTLLDRKLAAAHYVLVLVDMSDAVTSSKFLVPLDGALEGLAQKLGRDMTVGIYAFDGAEDIAPIQPFAPARKEGETEREPARLMDFTQRDPSANLHGAVRAAVHTLKDALDTAQQPLRFGTLVVIAAGPDSANRVSQAKMLKAIQKTKYDIFALGLGPDVDKDELKDLGRTEALFAPDPSLLKRTIELLGDKVSARTRRYYLLSYCSPARRGKRQLKIEAVAPDGAKGSLEAQFDATGFKPRCDPNQAPDFGAREAPAADAGEPSK